MELYLVFNELSGGSTAPATASKQDSVKWMEQFYKLYRYAEQQGVAGLRTNRQFRDLELVSGYKFNDFLQDKNVDQVLRSLLRILAQKLPYLADLPDIEDKATLYEFRFGGNVAHGLGAAWLLDSIAVSLATRTVWDTNEIKVESLYIDPETLELIPNPESVHHASSISHIDATKGWLQTRLLQTVTSVDALWKERKKRFSHLDFCASTEAQIRTLHGDSLTQVVKKLYELEFYCRGWKAGNFDRNQIKHCDPESETTMNTYAREHTFRCPDGTEKTFQWHLRFTSTALGAGRIFFYPVIDQRRIIVGHIGHKLPNTKSGR